MNDMLGPYQLGPNDENQGIYTGNARELAQAIPDESVDLIFTDPVYDRIDDYRWLAETAARVLKPDSPCLTWTATPLLSKVIRAMEPPLDYAWTLHLQRFGTPRPGKTGLCMIAQCLWMEKGKSKTRRKIGDWHYYSECNSALPSNNKHRWSKPVDTVAKWTNAFLVKDGVVIDFFAGGATVPAVCKMLGRRWLAFEIDPPTAELARKRVCETQPPLFVPQPEQLDMALT